MVGWPRHSSPSRVPLAPHSDNREKRRKPAGPPTLDEATRLVFDTAAAAESGQEKADLMRLASPVAHVTGTAPPFFIVHETVPFAQAELLYRALVAAGCQAKLVPLEGRTHRWTAQIDPPADLRRYWELAPMALPFFKRHLCR